MTAITTSTALAEHEHGHQTDHQDGHDTTDRRGLLGAVVRLTLLELRTLHREPGVLVGLIGFPAATVLVIAGVFGTTPDPDFGGVNPSEHYVVGYLGVSLAALGLITLPAHLAAHRELGVLRRLRAAGLDSRVIVGSLLLQGVVLGAVGGAIVLAVGGLAYGVPAPDEPFVAAGWFLAGLGCFTAVGAALGAVMPSSRAASAFGNLLFVPTFLLGGGGPPNAVMSDPMRAIAEVLPLSHVVGGMRLAWLGATDDPHAIWVPVLVGAVAVVVAVRALRREVL